MNKYIALSVALLFSGAMYAEQEMPDAATLKEKADKVSYTFSIAKGDCSDDAWSEVIDIAVDALPADEDNFEETIDNVCRAIKDTFAVCKEKDIHGNLNIAIGDENPAEKLPTRGCDGVCGGDDRNDK